MSALNGNKENAINGKQKDSAQRETLAVSAMRISVEKQHFQPLSFPKNRRLKTTGKVL